MLVILLTCLMPLIMLEVLLLVRPHMEAFKGNYEAACLSCGRDRSAERGESLLQGLFAAKKQPVNITSFPASFLDWCQRPCSCNALGWRWKQESWYAEVPTMAWGILIETSSEEQSKKYLFTAEGLDTAISLAFLIMSLPICMQSRGWALLSEAALKQLCPWCHRAVGCVRHFPACAVKPRFSSLLIICFPVAPRKRNGVCKLLPWMDASLDTLKGRDSGTEQLLHVWGSSSRFQS